jgi:hypothetical protein
MVIYDLVHGYQPFKDPGFHFPWVEKNLKDKFVPTSIAMVNSHVKRGVQLQGWTLDNWLQSSQEIVRMAEIVIDNVKRARELQKVEIGFSGYTHPILPLLSDDLLRIQLILDHEVVSNRLGEPAWFWPPEGAVDKKVLKILFELYPEVIPVIPDMSLGKNNFSGLIKVRHQGGGIQNVLVCNNILKDVFMNAMFYDENPHPQVVRTAWDDVKNIYEDGETFSQVFHEIDPELNILARDWENSGSVEVLTATSGGGLEIGGYLSMEAEFRLPSEGDWEQAILYNVEDILPGSWEVAASNNDPYIYWQPKKDTKNWQKLSDEEKDWTLQWVDYIQEYNALFDKYLETRGGMRGVLSNEMNKKELKEILPGLLSCVPWHYLANELWGPDRRVSHDAWQALCLPTINKLKEFK